MSKVTPWLSMVMLTGVALSSRQIEVRQDLVAEKAGQALWARRIAAALSDAERALLQTAH